MNHTINNAVKNPIKEIPNPAKNPNPHRYDTGIVWEDYKSDSSCSSVSETGIGFWQLVKDETKIIASIKASLLIVFVVMSW